MVDQFQTNTNRPILVVDDDLDILLTAGVMLELLGYSVTTCVDGREAISLYKNAKDSGTPYLTVLMDLKIPNGVGGKEAAEQILQFDNEAKLIVSSGYYDDPVMADHKRYGFCAALPKPYDMSTLAEVVASISSV
jgi:two-component system, cell cycle sensor histidine kinase and response regulator CckA